MDGSNFYYAVKKARGYALTEDEFSAFFSEIERLFDVKEIRFYDAVKDRAIEPDNYAKQQRFHARLQNKCKKVAVYCRPLQYVETVAKEKVLAAAGEMNFCDACKASLWSLLYNLGLVTRSKEKGIDVLLATDAIDLAQTRTPGWIIIVSGDADFVPAVKLIHRHNVKTLNLHGWKGSSNELRSVCTRHALIGLETGVPTIDWYGLPSLAVYQQ
ncbi:MAG: NYN domain-containing protein [Candidatus Micrarchaeota archaeon]